jgi:hypothetical protein
LYMHAMTCLETLLRREQATIRRVVARLRTDHRTAHPAPPPQPLAPERQRSERRERRYARYEHVIQLKAQGWSQRAIAQETGLHPQTVAISLKAGQVPERASHPPRSRVIEPYLPSLHQRWEQGEHNGRILFEEIRAPGYPAGRDLGLCCHSALADAWTNRQFSSRERGTPVSVVFSQTNPMAPLQRGTNGPRTALGAEPAGSERIDGSHRCVCASVSSDPHTAR